MDRVRPQSQVKKSFLSFTRVSRVLLQRKCACGGTLGPSGECEECRKNRQSLQRKTDNSGLEARSSSSVPLVIQEAVRSTGQPLDPATRRFLEPRFGHDFSQVRVHTGTEAAESARAVNAVAFTVGQGIHFGAGEYQPASAKGMQLLAHELAHTVQQRGSDPSAKELSADSMSPENDRLEGEARHAAEDVVAGRVATVVGTARPTALQRQDKDKKKPPQAPKVVSPVEPNSAQRKMIDPARRAAAIRTQIAMFKASGVQGAEALNEARRLAQVKFDWPVPNMDQISEVLSAMGGGLVNVDVKVAGAGDPECGSRDGYVRGHRPPIVLCPGFFKDPANAEGRIRTMIHEMAHVRGIGKADAAEHYFVVFDCDSKGVFESADSWANYVHCLSGRPPDKPQVLVVPKKSGTKAGKPP